MMNVTDTWAVDCVACAYYTFSVVDPVGPLIIVNIVITVHTLRIKHPEFGAKL